MIGMDITPEMLDVGRAKVARLGLQDQIELRAGDAVFDYFRLASLQDQGVASIDRLPFSTRILLENLLRNEDGKRVTADDVQNGKPDPEPYLKGAQLLGIDASHGLVVEDAPAGIRAAHAAGMKVIGLASTYKPEELSQADAIISKLADIQVRVNGLVMHIKVA